MRRGKARFPCGVRILARQLLLRLVAAMAVYGGNGSECVNKRMVCLLEKFRNEFLLGVLTPYLNYHRALPIRRRNE